MLHCVGPAYRGKRERCKSDSHTAQSAQDKGPFYYNIYIHRYTLHEFSFYHVPLS